MSATQWLEVISSYSLHVLIVVYLGRLLDRNVSDSSTRCFIWNACFVAVLALGIISLFLPRLHLTQPWSYLDPQQLLTVSSVQGVIGRLLVVVWAVGAGLAALKMIAREFWLRQKLRSCPNLSSSRVLSLVRDTIGNSDVADEDLPTILVSDENLGPCCWQFHRPTILLPRFILDGSSEDLRHVVIHELEHLRTNHPMHLFLQQLAQIICWFHPAVWTAACHASLAREYVCDDAAAENAGSCVAYMRTLLRIAERQCDAGRLSQAMGFSRARSEVVLRAARLARAAKTSSQRISRWQLRKTAVAMILLLATGVLSQAWLPLDSMSSSRSAWSPWPSWTAEATHCFGLNLRDYEQYDRRTQAYELQLETRSK